ncbi:hypothetical protein [Zobellia uliginosa]|uniref:hypothetical protein n=1 Tax=Zobellia uliginosa TaxID=143224 RepID=UPI0026E45190|nr:hypothetical protein [Zobellia uliginosa]MDO6519382.1 hypothetical protein [Zobellia uliginosa]
MGNLRIKLKYKSFEIELEGDKETVQSEFKDIKENGLGNIVMGVDMSETTYLVEQPNDNGLPKQIAQAENIDFTDSNIPSLKDVLMKQLPSSEREWILVYAYYGTEFGNKPFTGKTILEAYESTKRKTASRHANMSQNIKALFNKGYFSALNDEEFILTNDGKHQANEIITRTHSTPVKQNKPKTKGTKSKDSNNKKSKSSTSKFEVLKNLNLRPSDKISLTDYIKDFEIKSNGDRIIVIVNYLKEILKIDKVTIDHLYTAFFVLKCRIPASFYQVVTNTKGRSNWIDFDKVDNIKLSAQGLNRVRLDIAKKK